MFDLKTKILVLDDMITMRKLVVKVCRDLGFTEFVEASDGSLGWEALINASAPGFGLVISDWNMPNTSGLNLLKRVRLDPRFSNLPFLMVTGESEQGQIVEAMQAGVSNYVVKPFTPDTLRKKLDLVHKKHEAIKNIAPAK